MEKSLKSFKLLAVLTSEKEDWGTSCCMPSMFLLFDFLVTCMRVSIESLN